MVLVDTSLWIAHLRLAGGHTGLRELLEAGQVLTHPWVRGELALGNLGRHRKLILGELSALPSAPVVPEEELLEMIEIHRLSGLGWVDVQLLGSARLCGEPLWTGDRRLAAAAVRLGVSAI